MNTINRQLVIIGGGPAGLSAAVAAYDQGVKDILVIERDNRLGGILNQCIHNGFGLTHFKEELTGPEYAYRFMEMVEERKIDVWLNSMVISLTKEKEVSVINDEKGFVHIQAEAIILAMGCRERPRGALNIAGSRPSGIYTAGTAQRLVNMEGFMPGREVVILGSGDIGLIMARRMTLEGANVKMVCELMPYSGGLKRNIVQCLDDFDIPLRLSHTVVSVHGKERLEGVTIAKVDENFKAIDGTQEYVECDTLLLSVGLIPENELTRLVIDDMYPMTRGPRVDNNFETEVDGIFACGNVLHVHDLVDFVTQESMIAGKAAAKYVLDGPQTKGESYDIKTGPGVRYSIPLTVNKDFSTPQTVRFRVKDVYRDAFISVKVGDKEIQKRKKRVVAPGEMEAVVLVPKQFENIDASEITISIVGE